MINRRDATLRLVAALAAMASLGGIAKADATVSAAAALEAMNPWADALFSGAPTKICKLLAPECQIVRSDGSGYDRARTTWLSNRWWAVAPGTGLSG